MYSKELAHGGLVERAVVVPPPPYHRVVLPRHFGQRHRRLAMSRQPRTVCRIRFKASSLTPGKEAREELAACSWPSSAGT